MIFSKSLKEGSLPSDWLKVNVSPIFKYAAPIWDPHTLNDIQKIEMVHGRAARWVLGDCSPYSNVSVMLVKLGWRTLEQRRADSRLVLFYKIVHGYVAVLLPSYAIPLTRISRTSHPLENKFALGLTTTNTHFSPLTVVQWNSLPGPIATLTDLDSSKQAVNQVCHIKPLTDN